MFSVIISCICCIKNLLFVVFVALVVLKMTGIKSDIFPRLITPRKYYGCYK